MTLCPSEADSATDTPNALRGTGGRKDDSLALGEGQCPEPERTTRVLPAGKGNE